MEIFILAATLATCLNILSTDTLATYNDSAKLALSEMENVNSIQTNHYQPLDSDSHSTDADSITVTDAKLLPELVVSGEDRWIENGKVVFIPEKRAKNMDKDIPAMIDLMNTGILKVKDGVVMTQSREKVAIFINGIPADKLDEDTFWAKNALKVKYIPLPTDPAFMGEKYVLNIITKQYKGGGLTRLNALQTIPNSGNYEATSKVAWNKLSLCVGFWGLYDYDDISSTYSHEFYRDVYFNHKLFPLIDFTRQVQNRNHTQIISASVSLQYLNDKMRLTHSLTYSYLNNPVDSHDGLSSYNPAIIAGGNVLSSSSKRSDYFSLSGNYAFILNPKISLFTSWGMCHTNSSSNSIYQIDGIDPITNYANENSWSATLSARTNYTIKSNLNVGLQIKDAFNRFSINYHGNTNSLQDYTINVFQGSAYCVYSINPKAFIELSPEFSVYSRFSSATRSSNITPSIKATAFLQLPHKSTVDMGISCLLTNPAASTVNNLILRQTELKWIEGNPSLKPSQTYYFHTNYNIRPLSWLGFNALVMYQLNTNQSAFAYRSGGPDFAGVVMSYVNGNNYGNWQISPSVTLSPFRGNVTMSISGSYRGYHISSASAKNYFTADASLNWYIRNFRLWAKYRTPANLIENGGTATIKLPSRYEIGASYGNGNLIVEATAKNFLHRHATTKCIFNNGCYSYDKFESEIGRKFIISLTYTFDYGKKINPEIYLNSSTPASAILGI